jgi:hypothetical protein
LAATWSLEVAGGSNECWEERVTRAESRRSSAESSMSARSLRRGALATVDAEVSCEGQSRLRRWASRCDGRRVGRQFEVGEDLLDDAGVGEEGEELAFLAAVGTGQHVQEEDALEGFGPGVPSPGPGPGPGPGLARGVGRVSRVASVMQRLGVQVFPLLP